VKKYGKETIDGKTVGFNLNPGFANPGGTNIISATQLNTFDKYRLPDNSMLKTSGLDLKKLFGIETGGLNFSQGPASANGIGAFF
jgi:hypothetical protein